mmetsp:Transcript_32699/g.61439  ORF Transcript_32699/g.61439 Transcript_32699/m.61439 type:complete len:225 (-) Transcript_32699:19-693(-)
MPAAANFPPVRGVLVFVFGMRTGTRQRAQDGIEACLELPEAFLYIVKSGLGLLHQHLCRFFPVMDDRFHVISEEPHTGRQQNEHDGDCTPQVCRVVPPTHSSICLAPMLPHRLAELQVVFTNLCVKQVPQHSALSELQCLLTVFRLLHERVETPAMAKVLCRRFVRRQRRVQHQTLKKLGCRLADFLCTYLLTVCKRTKPTRLHGRAERGRQWRGPVHGGKFSE